jgi:hypothetical protein
MRSKFVEELLAMELKNMGYWRTQDLKWQSQEIPRISERSLPNDDNEYQLRSVIDNLRHIIAKKDAEITRLQSRLTEEQVKNLCLGRKLSG